VDYSDDMDEPDHMMNMHANTLSKKQAHNCNGGNSDGTKSIMRPSRKSVEEHNKNRAKLIAAANAAAAKNNGKVYLLHTNIKFRLQNKSCYLQMILIIVAFVPEFPILSIVRIKWTPVS
jgi:hypothetical protein